MTVRLERFDERLRNIFMIKGIGLSSNVFVIGKNDVTLVDTGVGNEMNRLEPKLTSLGIRTEDLSNVVITHAHYDHFGGLAEVFKIASPRVLVHPYDLRFLRKISLEGFAELKDGETITVGGRSLKVIHTPGHTIGSICLYDQARKILFSGDTVFPGGSFGRCDLEYGDIGAMVRSLKRLSTLKIDVMLPGHGEPVLRDADAHVRLSSEAAETFL